MKEDFNKTSPPPVEGPLASVLLEHIKKYYPIRMEDYSNEKEDQEDAKKGR